MAKFWSGTTAKAYADLAMMAFGVLVFSITVLAIMALSLLLWVMAAAGEAPHPVSGAVMAAMFAVAFWNLWASVKLVNDPASSTAVWIIFRSVLAALPLFVLLASR